VFIATINILELVHYIELKFLEKFAKLWKLQNWKKKKKKPQLFGYLNFQRTTGSNVIVPVPVMAYHKMGL
jgi:hypothetical protein